MSKMDELRRMREEKYARSAAHRGGQPQARPTPVAPVAPERTPAGDAPAEPTGLCGHRSMNGRTCTREAGHAAKNHRYA